jgi:hypothetical protein
MGIDLAQAVQVIVDGLLDRGVEILADVDAQDACEAVLPYAPDQVVDALVACC